MRVPHGDELVHGQERERERAAHLRKGFDQRLLDRSGLGPRVEVQDDLGVAVGLEDGPLLHQRFAQLGRVDQVTVVADGDRPVDAVDANRLRVGQLAFAGGRIPDVPDRQRPGQPAELRLVEGVGDMAHGPRGEQPGPVGGRDAGALLSPVLQRVQTEVDHPGGLRVSVDPEDPACFPELVEHGVHAQTSGTTQTSPSR